MLTVSRFRNHQSNQYHGEDVRERYVKGKSNGPQRQPMKNQTSNGRVSRFDAIRSTSEEKVLENLNEEREIGIILYKEGENIYTSCMNKSKGKRLDVQVYDHMGTTEYLDPNQKTHIHYMTNTEEEGKRQSIKVIGKHKGQTSKLMRTIAEIEH